MTENTEYHPTQQAAVPEYPCPKRHPCSGHFCERTAPHGGDHWTYEQRAWPQEANHGE